MPDIKIKNVPQSLVNKIDTLAAQARAPDRSSFLVGVLQEYCLYHDQYFIHCLPDTVRILAEDAANREREKVQKQLEYTLATAASCNKMMEQLYAILADGSTDEGDTFGDDPSSHDQDE